MKLKGYTIQNDGKYRRAVEGSPNALGALTGGVGNKATEGAKLAAYDRLGGLILSNGHKVKTGTFWDFQKNKRVEKPKVIIQLRVDGELIEFEEGKDLPMEVVARETIDKKKKEKKAKEVANKKKKREAKQAKAKKIMRNWIIKKLGGFTDIDEAIHSIDNSEDKHKILTLAVKDLYNTITNDDILKEENGVWYFKGRTVDPTTRKLLVAEAENFRKTKLWAILQDDIKYQSNKKMYTDSLSIDDIIAGKLRLLTLDTFKTRLNSLQRGSGKFNTTA